MLALLARRLLASELALASCLSSCRFCLLVACCFGFSAVQDDTVYLLRKEKRKSKIKRDKMPPK